MGRQVIGGVVGAAIGFVVSGFNPTGAYYGWVVGAAIGASTEVIKQPGIGDLASASAGEGGSRARVYGSFRPIGGQLVWDGGPREIRKRSSGKGGPRVESSIILRSYAIGVCEGPITTQERGVEGFGYDALFLPDGFASTFAEMDLEQKNAISHRGRALRHVAEWLRRRAGEEASA